MGSTGTIFNTALIRSPLVGTTIATPFDDLASVTGAGSGSVNTEDPIKQMVFMHGDVLDGIKIVYDKTSGQGSNEVTVPHGTSTDANPITKTTVVINKNEKIVVVSGMHGEVEPYGVRVAQISFVIYDSVTALFRTVGPFGSKKATPFIFTANGNFIAFGGYAENTNDTVAQATEKKPVVLGGIYGLYFIDVDHRTI
ncbi:hypothetical protein B0H13DRAFT_2345433 [Mycena leptocephala]|nr:hypothetical protein B0H13DRAFT_2345433 [Mycena leptocephala]